jgi:hypothetical protein
MIELTKRPEKNSFVQQKMFTLGATKARKEFIFTGRPINVNVVFRYVDLIAVPTEDTNSSTALTFLSVNTSDTSLSNRVCRIDADAAGNGESDMCDTSAGNDRSDMHIAYLKNGGVMIFVIFRVFSFEKNILQRYDLLHIHMYIKIK